MGYNPLGYWGWDRGEEDHLEPGDQGWHQQIPLPGHLVQSFGSKTNFLIEMSRTDFIHDKIQKVAIKDASQVKSYYLNYIVEL